VEAINLIGEKRIAKERKSFIVVLGVVCAEGRRVPGGVGEGETSSAAALLWGVNNNHVKRTSSRYRM
jgi:hypothetical protein